MVIDTFGFLAKALSFGAFDGVPITSSCPFQWNQMGTTLGVPSVHTYANRAGIFDCRSSLDTGCCKSSRPPCFTGIIPPVGWLVGQRQRDSRSVYESAWILRPFLQKVNKSGSSESYNLAAILRIRWRLVRMPIRGAVCGVVVIFLFATFSSTSFAQNSTTPPYDLAIIDAHIMDGSGSPWYAGTVAIKDGKIAAIGRIGKVPARRTIDAKGMVVSPGFIDLHSHSDFALLADGKAESKIRQGVTTEIIGESESAGPVFGPAIPQLDRELAGMGLQREWSTLGEYFAALQKHGTAVNIASYVGSGQIRVDVMGNVNRAPTPGELGKMRSLVEQAMQDGAIGLASGLIYFPHSYARTDELIELARVAAHYGGIYTTHIRDEGDTIP